MLRCYAVNGERYCSKCGEELGPSTYCLGCGTLYPDYCVVYSKKPAKRSFKTKAFSLNLSLAKSERKSESKSGIAKPTNGGRKTGSSNLRRQLLMVGAGIAFLAVIALLALLYIQNRAESKFTKEFVVALYGLKSGTEHCLKKSEILGNGTRLGDKDLAQLKSVKGEISTALQVLSPPPKKFNELHAQLGILSDTYEELYKLCITAAPSMQTATSAKALEMRFIKQAKEMKSALPPELLAELTAKVPRYTNLQFMLE